MFKQGANMPLFFSCLSRRLFWLVFPILFFLAGCQNTQPKPTLNATGYFDDTGAVRVWRKDLNNIPLTVVSSTIPYNDDRSQTVITYHYFDGSLSEITRKFINSTEVTEQLRFDEHKKQTFNQRVLVDRKEMIDNDVVEYLLYQAEQTLLMTTALQVGKVKLLQGRYQDGQITTCQGDEVYLKLDQSQREWLDKQLKAAKSANLAWLKSPEGEELLLMTEIDICATEPTLDSL